LEFNFEDNYTSAKQRKLIFCISNLRSGKGITSVTDARHCYSTTTKLYQFLCNLKYSKDAHS